MAGRPSLVLWALLTVGFGVAVSSCGTPGFRTCEVDSDCRNNEICAEPEGTTGGRCAKRCDGDEDCDRPGTTCQPYVDPNRDQDEEICLSADVGTGSETGTRCTTDEDCEGFDAGPAVCGINGRCIFVEQRRAVRIVDRSREGESGGDGSEIAAVYLEDNGGQVVAFGDTISWCPGNDTGGNGGSNDAGTGDADTGTPKDTASDTGAADSGGDARDVGGTGPTGCSRESSIDGTMPQLSADQQCIDGPESATTQLGVGGDLLVEFVGGDGRRVEIDNSHTITVIEWDENCDSADAETDIYDIELCTTNGESFDRTDCRPLATGQAGKSTVPPNLSDSTSN